MQITENMLARFQKDLTNMAKEEVKVEHVGTALYAFGSELAVLRIFAKYQANGAHHNPNARVGFSTGSSSHYFSLDI